jgi:hypothetical protein
MSANSPSPTFYRVVAVLFFAIGGVLIWYAITHHEWFYWAFAAVTLLNGLMSTLKSFVVRETGN